MMLADRLAQLLAVLLTCSLLACQSSPEERETMETTPAATKAVLELPGLLADPGWLSAHLDHPQLVILDSRPEEEYRSGHILQAISLPTSITFDVEREHKLPSVPEVEKLLSRIGVDAGKTVVVYDQGNLRWAARMLWMLEVHGHERVAVLSGGYAHWLAEELATETTARQPTPSTFIANVAPEHLATLFQTRRSIDDPETAIVDVRSPDEYSGLEDRWPRNGHIPSAVNVEWTHNLLGEADIPTIRDPSGLRELYPFEPGTRVITYCTHGRRAAVSYLALRLAGFEAAVYDGSWEEWTSHSEVPVANSGAPDGQQVDAKHAAGPPQ